MVQGFIKLPTIETLKLCYYNSNDLYCTVPEKPADKASNGTNITFLGYYIYSSHQEDGINMQDVRCLW